MTEAGAAPAVRLRGITKRFGAVLANDAVDVDVSAGTIHGIIGENGAGKSTLTSILYGFYAADAGEIEVDGRPVRIASSADAIRLGIGMVHQHFMLVPTMTVLENVMLGAEGGWRLGPGRRARRAELTRLAEAHGLAIDPDARVGDLPVGLQQRVEILKALGRGARILILDEPTGVLTPGETDRLLEILRALKRDGVTVILITHKLREIMDVTDRVTVMRQGRVVGTRETAATGPAELAEMMVGRSVLMEARRVEAVPGPALLRVEGLGCADAHGVRRLGDVSFELRAGEVLGIAGVAGNGQSELLDLLAGIRAPGEGAIILGNRRIDAANPADPAEMRRLRLAHVPEDRHYRGLVLGFEAAESAALGYHDGPALGPGRLIDRSAARAHCAGLMQSFDVRPPDPRLATRNFSGGNQQKLVLAREIEQGPKVLLVGQPTRGVDIGAIEFIHQRILGLKAEGCAILLVSVELDEVMALSDRILVLNAGRVVGILPRAEADRQRLGLMMAGMAERSAA